MFPITSREALDRDLFVQDLTPDQRHVYLLRGLTGSSLGGGQHGKGLGFEAPWS